jgi:hypothetical protein
MPDHIIDGRATGRQQLLHLLREVCDAAGVLCEPAILTSGIWQDRAAAAIRSCTILQRGLYNSHPQLADELHILATEIQIALAAQTHDALFAARIDRIRETILHLQQSGAEL